jgi:hypothetical protein
MPQLVRRKLRRLYPSFSAAPSANSFSRASNRRCCGVCGKGLNSPLEIIRVGAVERNAARLAGLVCANSRSRTRHRPLLTAFRSNRRVNARTDFSKCSSLIGSVIFAAPGVNSTTSPAPNRGLANPAIGPGVGARLLRFLEAADERDELPAIII